jgi:hypothetical protein
VGKKVSCWHIVHYGESNFPPHDGAPEKSVQRDLRRDGAALVLAGNPKMGRKENSWFRDCCGPATSLEETAPNFADYTPVEASPNGFPTVILFEVLPELGTAPQGQWDD